MKNSHGNISLQKIPLLRLLLSLITGIIIQYCFSLPLQPFVIALVIAIVIVALASISSVAHQFLFRKIVGTSLLVLFVAIGGVLSFVKNGIHDKEWIGNYYKEGLPVLLTLQEPLVAKEKSYKALASAESVMINHQWQPVKGNVLLYFIKGNIPPTLTYGSQIVVTTSLTNIENTGNPDGFDYREHSFFNHIYYQAFLKPSGYLLLNTKNTTLLGSIIIKAKFAVLTTLRKNIANPTSLSVAEALLIGYRDDLGKDLIQAYNNTGVIHIIVISGLRMGMIYGLLLLLFSPFKTKKWVRVVKAITIIIVLWGFCLVAGAAPSVSRSAIMFTVIVLGECIGRRTNIFNNLALSAFIILLVNPFSLWDAGFQLSYAAVVGIIIFYPLIRNWFFFQNKILAFAWNLSAVTLAAQILTLPLILFHFHQLPILFLFTNLLAVPLSCIILYADLLLLIFSQIPFLALLMGKIVSWMLTLMNTYITNVNDLPFSVWQNLQVSLPQVLLLYGCIIGIAGWLMLNNKRWLLTGLSFFAVFEGFRAIYFLINNP
jgi:competence protein ComEC